MHSTPRHLYLGIETSGPSTGLALVSSDQVVYEEVSGTGTGHDELLLGLLAKALKTTGVTLTELAGTGVTIGPGMFTALRVGLSTAKGLALAQGIPVKGINTLWALARAADVPGQPVLAVMDARKAQVYAGLYVNGEPAMAPSVLTPAELAGRLQEYRELVAVGDGAELCLQALRTAGMAVRMGNILSPPPRTIALAAAQALRAGQSDDVAALEPLYLRRTDAELNREKRT